MKLFEISKADISYESFCKIIASLIPYHHCQWEGFYRNLDGNFFTKVPFKLPICEEVHWTQTWIGSYIKPLLFSSLPFTQFVQACYFFIKFHMLSLFLQYAIHTHLSYSDIHVHYYFRLSHVPHINVGLLGLPRFPIYHSSEILPFLLTLKKTKTICLQNTIHVITFLLPTINFFNIIYNCSYLCMSWP